jgi:predicted nucleic-acid-binding protein
MIGGRRMVEVVDTNVILRYLVGDDKVQQEQAKRWFREAKAGKRRLVIKPLVVAEACFVLESFYKQGREIIAGAMEVFLAQKWLRVEERTVILGMWQYYRQKLHFVDSYLLSWAKATDGGVLTFDAGIKKTI